MKIKLLLLLSCFFALTASAQHDKESGRSASQSESDTCDPMLGTEENRLKPLRSITVTVNGVSFKMVRVEAGSFYMGATSEQEGRAYKDERPVHKVTLTDDYYMGVTEVTQELWEAVMGSNPSKFRGKHLPVEGVSLYDCACFLDSLNRLTGFSFGLPTEAEWEYAARGGNRSRGYVYSGSNEIASVAWYGDNSENTTHEVATLQPNELGLYDMSGNVAEWCADKEGPYMSEEQTNPTGAEVGDEYILRGGGWHVSDRDCRLSYRRGSSPFMGLNGRGLRLVHWAGTKEEQHGGE